MASDRILIADDEADISLILKLQLEDAGYRTVRVKDGVEALEALAREKFDLLLLDIKMPRMDGLQVLKRARESWPAMVVVMMTAHGSEEVAVAAMKEGAVDYISKPFSNEDMLKRVERAITYNRTVQENRQLQEALAAEQRKTEAILEGMAELLIAVDTSGTIISVNRMTEYMLGRDRQALIGKDLDKLFEVCFSGDPDPPLRKVLSSGSAALDNSYFINGPLGTIPVLSSATPLYDNAGHLLGAVEIIRDISTLKALEREREDFVSMLSHDLKNPITAIVGSLDLVREGRLGPVNKDQREFIESAEESCSEMVEMINSLLDIHKFEAGRMVMKCSPERLQVLLDKVVAQYSTAAEKGLIRLSCDVPADLPECTLDRSTFVRMMGNLLSNALKFTPEKGVITVSADLVQELFPLTKVIPAGLYPAAVMTQPGSFLRITVKDSGVGMPRESLAEIFDRFVQARNRREGKTRGTGLGLAFCRKVMDAHKGLIWAESEEGNGSVFNVLLPLAPEPVISPG
jgi:PAS domain S-box-containing protein